MKMADWLILWFSPVIPALWKWRKEDQEFKLSLVKAALDLL